MISTVIFGVLLGLTAAANAQNGKAQGNPHSRANPPAVVNQPPAAAANRNGPATSPAVLDRDKGRDRAEDVGRGKKKGLYKPRKHKKH